MHFASGDQRLAVGSRPAGRRWQVKGNNYLFSGPAPAVLTVPPDFRQCEGLGVDSRKQTDAVLAYCKAKLTRKICPNGAIARKSGSPSRPSSRTFLTDKVTDSSIKQMDAENAENSCFYHEKHESGTVILPQSAQRSQR